MARLIILSIIQSLLLCGGQVFLKLAVLHMDKSLDKLSFFLHSIVLNWWLLGCGIFMTGAGLLWMYILRHFPFAHAYPLTALSFVFGSFAAILIFHETVNWVNWIGIGCILIGCYLIGK